MCHEQIGSFDPFHMELYVQLLTAILFDRIVDCDELDDLAQHS